MTPAPRQSKNIFTGKEGGLRAGWCLAISLSAYAIAALATRYGLVRAFAALFEAWGIDASNAHLAPAWARALYIWHGSLATSAFALLSLGQVRLLRPLWGVGKTVGHKSPKGLLRAVAAGIVLALLIAALGLLPDSLRLEWPLSAPRLSGSLPVLLIISLVGTLAEEAFTKRLLYDGLEGRWGKAWAAAVACGVFFLANGGYAAGAVGAINVLLLGLIGCLLYRKYGLWSVVGFRWGWGAVNMFLLGFGGGEAAVYRLYGVSEKLLTGGDGGPMYGLWTTLALAGMAAWLLFHGRGKRAVNRKQTV